MAATTIGLNTLQFGTSSVTGGVIVSSFEETIKSEPVELLKGDGTFQAVAYANPQTNASMTIVGGSSAYSGVGAAFGIAGNSLLTGEAAVYIENIQITKRNDGFSETSLSLVGWDNLGQSS